MQLAQIVIAGRPLPTGSGSNAQQLFELANVAVAYALLIAGFLSVVFIFYGGISFILSGGDSNKVKAAIDTIRYAIIGLVIVIFSFTIVAIVGRFFGYDLISYISFARIVEIIERIAGR